MPTANGIQAGHSPCVVFNTRQRAQAQPMIWWYAPRDPNTLFFPALDCHTGAVPDLKARVDVDHFLAVSTTKEPGPRDAQTVRYRDAHIAANIKELLPTRISGSHFSGKMPQGDFVFDLTQLEIGVVHAMRKLPPGA